MKRAFSLPMGCLTLLLIVAVIWVALRFVWVPELEKDANRQGHKLKDYTNRLIHGR